MKNTKLNMKAIVEQLNKKMVPIAINDSNDIDVFFGLPEDYWEKCDFNADGKLEYWENSEGMWNKYEHDADGNMVYYENSNGYWIKYEYDSCGNEIYYENSNGVIIDNRK